MAHDIDDDDAPSVNWKAALARLLDNLNGLVTQLREMARAEAKRDARR